MRPDPAQRGRLEEIRVNLHDRIAEAEREGWLGEIEGLRVSLAGTEDKLAQIDMALQRLGMPVRWGLGYGLFGNTYGWGGWGGAIVMIDPDERMAVAYVTNQMREPADDTRGLELISAAYDGLKGLRA